MEHNINLDTNQKLKSLKLLITNKIQKIKLKKSIKNFKRLIGGFCKSNRSITSSKDNGVPGPG